MESKKEINNNGYAYVDLDLPSGTLWATCNVGADSPSDYGLYFQWGDTIGYSIDQVGIERGQKEFSWTDYKFSKDRNGSKFSKYTSNRTTLDLEDDAAYVNMGGNWHMPTPTQIKELTANTTSTWITLDGVNGRLFSSKADASKSIFIPAAGGALGGSVRSSGDYGFVWSSMLYTVNASYGQFLIFGSDYALLYCGSRYGGLSVRGVIG